MGKFSRDKGYRFEAAVVNAAKAMGLKATRVPLSGAMPGFTGDVEIEATCDGETRTLELKHRESLPRYLFDWLGEHDALLLKKNRQKPVVLITLDEYLELLQ